MTTYGVDAIHPDDFVLALLDANQEAVTSSVRNQRRLLEDSLFTAVGLLETLREQRLDRTAARLQAKSTGSEALQARSTTPTTLVFADPLDKSRFRPTLQTRSSEAEPNRAEFSTTRDGTPVDGAPPWLDCDYDRWD